MPRYVWTESAAATAVGSLMNNGQRGQQGAASRRVKRIAVVGSAAAGDAAIDLFYGETFIGRYFNTSTGTAPVESKDFQAVPQEYATSPGEFINVFIADAGATNAIQVTVEVEELGG